VCRGIKRCCRGVLLEREKSSNRELVAQLIEMESRVSFPDAFALEYAIDHIISLTSLHL
jgi:hypothetical protein